MRTISSIRKVGKTIGKTIIYVNFDNGTFGTRSFENGKWFTGGLKDEELAEAKRLAVRDGKWTDYRAPRQQMQATDGIGEAMDTLYVCNKCGRTEELSEAQRAGWLIHQRIDAPQGNLIIRCTEHVTGHALRLAGLPQQTDSRRIADNLERGLYAEYGSGYTAVACEVETEDGIKYNLAFHKEALPAFNALEFDTVPALIAEMRKVEPDLRKWHLVELE